MVYTKAGAVFQFILNANNNNKRGESCKLQTLREDQASLKGKNQQGAQK